MIKYQVNTNKGNTHCYQVSGTIDNNGRIIKTKFFVWADNSEEAKTTLKNYQLVRRIEYNLQTLGDAQTAYKKEKGAEVELDSEEFLAYIK